ncbi:MAG: Rmf/CrpP family protein [Hyphomonadaceae bacterium]
MTDEIPHTQQRHAATLGKQSAANGLDESECPYPEGDALRDSWLLGYRNEIARQEAEARRIASLDHDGHIDFGVPCAIGGGA